MHKPDLQYYRGSKNDAELKKWRKCPYVDGLPHLSVPENLLPAIKASFLCYSQGNRQELMDLLAK